MKYLLYLFFGILVLDIIYEIDVANIIKITLQIFVTIITCYKILKDKTPSINKKHPKK